MPKPSKHKVKWHDTVGATADQAGDTVGFLDATEGNEEEFSLETPFNGVLPQSHPEKRQHLMRKAKKNVKHTRTHLFAVSALLALSRNSFAAIIDSGENILA